MGLAAKMIYQDFDAEMDKLYGLREQLIELVSDIPDVFVNGPEGRLGAPHIISLTVPGVRAEVLLHALEGKGVYVSSGSACATNRPHLSGTLHARPTGRICPAHCRPFACPANTWTIPSGSASQA